MADHDDETDLDDRVGDRVRQQPAEVRERRHRCPADPLQDALLAQEREVEGERGERRRHHRHPRDARDERVEVLGLVPEHRCDQEQEQERQHEVEEGGARVAPEHPPLEAELAPEERAGAHADSPSPLAASAVSSR